MQVALCILISSGSGSQIFDGFGRFGRSHSDGLLTLNVSPTGFRTLNYEHSLVAEWSIPEAPKVASIDGTQKTLLFKPSESGPVALHWSLLYPGFSAKIGSQFRVSFKLERSNAPIRLKPIADGILIGTDTSKTTPLAIFFPQGVKAEISENMLILTSSSLEAEIRFFTPTGILPMGLDQPQVQEQANLWQDVSVPVLSSYQNQGGWEVQVFEGSIAPISPIHTFVKIPEGVKKGPLTRLGDFLYVPGTTAKVKLPDLRTEARGYVIPEDMSSEIKQLASELAGETHNNWAQNGVDLAYSRRVPSLMSFGLMSPKFRMDTLNFMKRDLLKAFTISEPTWKIETEPLTNKRYAYTYALPGPGGGKYDIEWGNLLPIYGLYHYALGTGDLDMVKSCWPGVLQAMRFIEISQDWAWMTNVNTDHGFSTGTGDPVNAAFAGIIGAIHLAESIGDNTKAQEWKWIAQRMTLAASSRLSLTNFATKHQLIAPNRIALGFHETESFTRSPLDGDPWYPASLFSGNGAFPELLSQYAQDNPKGLLETLHRLERAYPNWFDGDHKYPFKSTYSGNSVYVTYPHIFARLWSPQTAKEITPKLLKKAATNRVHAWVAPNVLAEYVTQDVPIVLTKWLPAGLADAKIHRETVTVKLVSPSPRKAEIAWKILPSHIVSRATLNGNPATLTRNGITVNLPAGSSTLVLDLRKASGKTSKLTGPSRDSAKFNVF